jgi:hypothetical protein
MMKGGFVPQEVITPHSPYFVPHVRGLKEHHYELHGQSAQLNPSIGRLVQVLNDRTEVERAWFDARDNRLKVKVHSSDYWKAAGENVHCTIMSWFARELDPEPIAA